MDTTVITHVVPTLDYRISTWSKRRIWASKPHLYPFGGLWFCRQSIYSGVVKGCGLTPWEAWLDFQARKGILGV